MNKRILKNTVTLAVQNLTEIDFLVDQAETKEISVILLNFFDEELNALLNFLAQVAGNDVLPWVVEEPFQEALNWASKIGEDEDFPLLRIKAILLGLKEGDPSIN